MVGAFHLIALATNGCMAVVCPHQYEAIMTGRTAAIVIVFSWLSPILFTLLYFSSFPGQGFQSENCANIGILDQQSFRLILASVFFAPLPIMILMYSHIVAIAQQRIDRGQLVRIRTRASAKLLILSTRGLTMNHAEI